MTKPLCIYHSNCFDGFSSAWAVWKRFGDAWEYHPGIYQDSPPDVTGRDVAIVDFSYKIDVLVAMAAKANSVVVLDHHKTAQEDLSRFTGCTAREWNPPAMRALCDFDGRLPIEVLFDMERSGAGITWDFFHPYTPRPAFINHVEDRDLWRFNLPFTREVHAAMSAYPFDFGAWDEIASANLPDLISQGAAIDRKHLRDIDALLAISKTRTEILGHSVPIANLPVTMCSDAGNIMAKGEKFAATYYDGPTHRHYSLRSAEDGLDVSAIAKAFGGGGHKHASGFRIPLVEMRISAGPDSFGAAA